MAYPGFETGPSRSKVRRANHCAIGVHLVLVMSSYPLNEETLFLSHFVIMTHEIFFLL
jgi:hypothetical protein